MKQSIGQVALVIRDYDEAVDFYVNRRSFTLVEDAHIEASRGERRSPTARTTFLRTARRRAKVGQVRCLDLTAGKLACADGPNRG